MKEWVVRRTHVQRLRAEIEVVALVDALVLVDAEHAVLSELLTVGLEAETACKNGKN